MLVLVYIIDMLEWGVFEGAFFILGTGKNGTRYNEIYNIHMTNLMGVFGRT